MSDDQLDFFPVPVAVTPLGARGRAKGVWRVLLPRDPKPHMIFHDRHGWYCEEHGRGCAAVGYAQRFATG